MDMKDVFERLKNLQNVLLRKNELDETIANAPSVLHKHEQLLARLKQEYREKNTTFEELRSEINRLKAELFEVEKGRDNAEKSMETVETQRDYEVLEKRIAEAKHKEEALRNEIEHQNEYLKMIDTEMKDAEKEISEHETEIKDMRISLEEETKRLTNEIADLDAEKDELAEKLEHETLFKFERIIKNKHGDGIVAVRNGVCSGCHMILPAQFANEVRGETELKYCPYCSRVLYHEETDETSDEYIFDEADLGGLADLDD